MIAGADYEVLPCSAVIVINPRASKAVLSSANIPDGVKVHILRTERALVTGNYPMPRWFRRKVKAA